MRGRRRLRPGAKRSPERPLSGEAAHFFDQHHTYDRRCSVTHLVNWLAHALYGHGPEERGAFVRDCARGAPPRDVPSAVAAVLVQHTPVAALTGDFSRRFRGESRGTPFPAEAPR